MIICSDNANETFIEYLASTLKEIRAWLIQLTECPTCNEQLLLSRSAIGAPIQSILAEVHMNKTNTCLFSGLATAFAWELNQPRLFEHTFNHLKLYDSGNLILNAGKRTLVKIVTKFTEIQNPSVDALGHPMTEMPLIRNTFQFIILEISRSLELLWTGRSMCACSLRLMCRLRNCILARYEMTLQQLFPFVTPKDTTEFEVARLLSTLANDVFRQDHVSFVNRFGDFPQDPSRDFLQQ